MMPSPIRRPITDRLLSVVRTSYNKLSGIEERVAAERRKTLTKVKHLTRLSILGKVAAGVMHDIRNPLTVILGNLQFIDNGLRTLSSQIARFEGSDKLKSDINIIIGDIREVTMAAQKINRIISSFMGLGRKASIPSEKIDVIRVVEEVRLIIEALFKTKDVAFVVEQDRNCLPLIGNQQQFNELIFNLLDNALQATPPKGEVKLSIKSRSAGIRIDISDSGSGIEEVVQTRIFDPFFTTKKRGEGFGLGLALVKERVEAMEGKIRFKSTVGEGTTFILDFPYRSFPR
jgi:signal transduction histidine kinase